MRVGVGIDLRRARDDVGYFAKCSKWPLTEKQREAIKLDTLVTAIIAPRQSGKSHALALLAVWWATRRRDQFVLIISGGDTAAVRLMEAIRKLARTSPLLADSVIDEKTRRIELSNGSAIESVPTSEFQIRSATVDLLIFDEAGVIPQSIVAAAEPTLAAREGGRIVYAGTPWRLDSPFHRVVQLGDRGSPTVRTVRWSLDDAPHVNWQLVEYHRESMAEAVFRAEYEGVWGGTSDALLSRELLDAASADYQLVDLADMPSEVALLGGVDWGRRHDQTAHVGIARLPTPDVSGAVFAIATVTVWPRNTPTTAAVRDLLGSPAWWRCLSYEDNGVGCGPADTIDEKFGERNERLEAERGGRYVELAPRLNSRGLPGFGYEPEYEWIGPPALVAPMRNRVTTTAQVKAEMLGQLKAMLERGRLILPRDGVLLRQLQGLRVEFRPSGATSIAADAETRHDDVADACWLALGPIRGSNLSMLNEAALDPIPDADISADGDRVMTGAGIEIPRRPLFQSVASTDAMTRESAKARPAPSPIDRARERVRASLADVPAPPRHPSHLLRRKAT